MDFRGRYDKVMQESPSMAELYDPLPTEMRHFRLLKRVQNPVKTKPCFELKSFPRTQSPEFHALSDTWGCPFPADHALAKDVDWHSASSVIEVKDRDFMVQPNLADLLNEFSILRMGLSGCGSIPSASLSIDPEPTTAET